MLPSIDKEKKTLTFKSPIIQRKSLVSHLEKFFGFNQVDERKFLSTNSKAATIQKRLEEQNLSLIPYFIIKAKKKDSTKSTTFDPNTLKIGDVVDVRFGIQSYPTKEKINFYLKATKQ